MPLLLSCLLSPGACNREKDEIPPPGPWTPEHDAKPRLMEAERDKEQKVRVELVKADLEEMLKRIDTKIAQMKEDMSGVDEATREKYRKAIPVLEEQKKNGQEALRKVEAAPADKWREVEDQAEETLNKMRRAYDRVVHE